MSYIAMVHLYWLLAKINLVKSELYCTLGDVSIDSHVRIGNIVKTRHNTNNYLKDNQNIHTSCLKKNKVQNEIY